MYLASTVATAGLILAGFFGFVLLVLPMILAIKIMFKIFKAIKEDKHE